MFSALNTSKKLNFLIFVVIAGLISIATLTYLFNNLVSELDNNTHNTKAKIQIGEYISDDLTILKSSFFELPLSTSKQSRDLIVLDINIIIKRLDETLFILENGGTLVRKIYLNIEGYDSFTKSIIYFLNKNNDGINLGVIDISPKLIKLKSMLVHIDQLLSNREHYKKIKDNKKYYKSSRTIKRFYKTIPAFFNRMNENTKRLLYEGDIELKKLNKNIDDKKVKYAKLEFFLVISNIFIVLLIGLWIKKQINKDNTKLSTINKKLAQKEDSINAILNGQKNIVIVSDGVKMIKSNETIIDFFDQFKTMDDFTSKHECICDLFETDIPDDSYIVKKDYDGDIWLNHILNNPDMHFKVIMNNGREKHHFSIHANKKYISNNEDFIVIVSLNDITSEIKSQAKLAQLNNNLEDIINSKTEELQELNNNLEIKIKKELAKNRQQDKRMIQQSRSAALGEMIGNIAHQWRQPLSAITSTASSQQVQIELGIASNDETNKALEEIKKYVTFLNQTIDDFRNFSKENKEKEHFSITDVVNKSYSIASVSLKDNNIETKFSLTHTIEDSYGSASELSQVFLNVINNARDALIENSIRDKLIHIRDEQVNGFNLIYFQDNAGGIPSKIMDKVFDPYFTTKHQSQGTGIGLYMSKDIVEKHFKGYITVRNKTVVLDGKEYNGASFKIKLPIAKA